MIVTGKALSRRTILRGLGATLALPLLDSMSQAFSATARMTVNRFGVVYVPNGMIMENYLPKAEGAGWELTPTLQTMEPFRDHLLILSGLNSLPGPLRPGGAHAKATTRFLTDVTPPTSETWLDAQGISMDQILAEQLGKQTQVKSLELAIESGETAGACDTGFACPYTNTISWKSANTPLPTENNPRVVFERLFGDSGSTDAKTRLRRLHEQRSVLDSVGEELARLKGTLPTADRTKLVEYFDAIRDIEQRIQIAEEQNDRELPVMGHPAGIPVNWEDHVRLMFDLETIAYQCDLTRIITMMIGHEHSGMTYPQIGVPDAHHPISHHQREPEKIAKVAKINAYHMKMFAYFLEKLRTTPDGDGTLLDHMTLIYGAGIADSNAHASYNLPVMLAGGGAGNLKGGRHIQFKNVPLANLHLTLLDQFGVQRERLGDSTGRVDRSILSFDLRADNEHASALPISDRVLLLVCGLGQAATGDTRLIDAAKNNDPVAVKVLLNQHAPVNATQGDGSTALHWAAHRDNLALADLLLRNGAKANAANDDGATPLYLACTNRSAPMVERLLTGGADANAVLPNGETVLMNCARTGEAKAVKALLVHGAKVNASESAHRQTALMWAAAEKHPDVVALLVEFGADVRARSLVYTQTVVDENTQRSGREKLNYDVKRGGATALLFAARVGDVESARILLSKGADANDCQPDGLTALQLAAYSGQGAVGILLLDKGANPNPAEIGYTALHAAVLRSELDLVKALLAHGANPNGRLTKGTPIRRENTDYNLPKTLLGITPYLLAAKFCEPAIMQALAEGGADVKIAMPNGATALMLAAGMGSSGNGSRRGIAAIDFGKAEPESSVLETVKMAIRLGADVNAASQTGDTALHTAAAQGQNSVVRFLVASGASLDVKNQRGQTPLTAAIAGNRRVRPADDAGADVNVTVRPSDAGHESTADLLRKLAAEQTGGKGAVPTK